MSRKYLIVGNQLTFIIAELARALAVVKVTFQVNMGTANFRAPSQKGIGTIKIKSGTID